MSSDTSTEMNSSDMLTYFSNFSEIVEKMQKVQQTYLQNGMAQHMLDQMTEWFSTHHALMEKIIFDPPKLMSLYTSYAQDYFFLLEKTWANINNTETQTPKSPEEDKRFKDAMWDEHPFFAFLKQNYCLTKKHVEAVLGSFENLNDKEKNKLQFYTEQVLDAVAPTNFIFTNPQILESTITSKGENLKKGLDNFIADIEREGEQFQIQMTDVDAFTLGKNIAITPGKVIYQNELMQLIQYTPQTEKAYKIPLLVIPPWINKYYILDLSEQNSYVNWLVQQGYTVFMISWVNPNKSLSHKSFEDYMLEGPLAALNIITHATDSKKINAVGYCIGGTLLACLLAYLAEKGDKRINSATYLATMLDFTEPGNLGIFTDESQIELLQKRAEKLGYLDGPTIANAFNLLRANDLIWNYFVKNYLQGEKPYPMDILYWNADSTNLPEKMVNFYLNNMYLHNRLIQSNGITLAHTPINLQSIKVPAYFLSTQQDHIAPWQSTYTGMRAHSGPTTFVLGGSGHIAGIVNPPQKNKYYYYTNKNKHENPDAFLMTAQQQQGSWWPHWHEWMKKYNGSLTKARVPEEGRLRVLGDAPGEYVKVKWNATDKFLLPNKPIPVTENV